MFPESRDRAGFTSRRSGSLSAISGSILCFELRLTQAVEELISGRGVPDEFRESIFEKFSQADSSDTRQKGGTGLGLSIAKAIVEHHDGEIGFDSEVGIGSTFFFLLPVSKEPVPGHEQRFGRPRVNQTSA